MKQSFKTALLRRGPAGGWTFLRVPFDVPTVFGTKARVAVRGTINGFPFRNSLMPNGDGTHSMVVNKILQSGAGARAGDEVSVIIELDTRKRTVAIPKELRAALATDQAAAKIFPTLSPSHRKELADWVGGAKQSATRLTRARKALPLIRQRLHAR
jgi:hypothetical protein